MILLVFGVLFLGVLIPFAALLLPFFLWLGTPTVVGLGLLYLIQAARRQRFFRILHT